jgi:hypothetical protein
MSDPKTGRQLTKRQFLRRVLVGGGTVMFVAGDYLRPEVETLLGPQVAQAKGSGYPNFPRGRGRRRRW